MKILSSLPVKPVQGKRNAPPPRPPRPPARTQPFTFDETESSSHFESLLDHGGEVALERSRRAWALVGRGASPLQARVRGKLSLKTQPQPNRNQASCAAELNRSRTTNSRAELQLRRSRVAVEPSPGMSGAESSNLAEPSPSRAAAEPHPQLYRSLAAAELNHNRTSSRRSANAVYS